MKYTVVFRTHESFDYSFGLVFIPCPCWISSVGDFLLNLNPSNPSYQLGSVKKLLTSNCFKDGHSGIEDSKECIVIVHPTGNGSKDTLDSLTQDLHDEGFKVKVVYFGE